MALGVKDAFALYEDGKHRRYGILFAVNGAAFAIAKLLAGEPGKSATVLGGLNLSQLSLGMMLFTIVMVWDIFAFGLKMRDTVRKIGDDTLPGVFGPQGMIVLLLLGVLMFVGWFLVGLHSTLFA